MKPELLKCRFLLVPRCCYHFEVLNAFMKFHMYLHRKYSLISATIAVTSSQRKLVALLSNKTFRILPTFIPLKNCIMSAQISLGILANIHMLSKHKPNKFCVIRTWQCTACIVSLQNIIFGVFTKTTS